MKCTKEMMRLYAVTDRAWTQNETLYAQVEKALKGGVTCVQLREKELDEATFLEEAKQIKQLCKQYHVPLIINDNVEVAIACDADGIHVGQHDMEAGFVRQRVGDNMMIGVSCQNVSQAMAAKEAGADYLGVGSVFVTTTKLDAKAVSYETLKEICQEVDLPIVAIGGINSSNILQLKGSGVDGVALVSAIFAAEDIEDTCRQLYSLSTQMVENQ